MSVVQEVINDLKRAKIDLQTVSEDVIKAEVIRRVVYKKADFISTGLKVVGVQEFENLDVKSQFPSYMTVAYPVAEGARGEHSKITWTDFTMSMKKAEGSFMITDEATVRGLDKIQYNTGVRRLSEALAKAKDNNILETLDAGAGNTIDCSNAAYDTPEEAIPAAIGMVLKAKGVSDEDLSKTACILPVDHWQKLLKLTTIKNVVTSLKEYFGETYGLKIYPTKYSGWTNEGILLLTGEDTAIHGVLRPPADVPLVETKRHVGVGVEYVVRQFFATKVVPEEAGSTTTKRIVKFTNLNSWS